jgi:hypothetical protein
MAKFMLLIYGNHEGWSALGPEGSQRIMAAHRSVTDELVANGELVDTHELSPSAARVVRTTDGSPTVTDGPFVETKEIVAGYYIVECASIERATEIAGRLGEAEFAPIEVRQFV